MRTGQPLKLTSMLLIGAMGCSVSTQTQYQDQPVGSRPYARVVPTGAYEASARVEGVNVNVALSELASCERGETPLVHRIEHRTRTAHPSPWGLAVPGLLLALAGPGLSFGAKEGPSSSDRSPQIPLLAYQVAGGVAAAVGVGLLIGSLVQVVRARDSFTDVGTVELSPIGTTRDCNSPLPKGTAVALSVSGQHGFDTTVDSSSMAHFSILNAESRLVPTASTPLWLWIHGVKVPFSISSDQARGLRDALLSDARSLARQELRVAQKSQCSRAVSQASDYGIPALKEQADAAIAAWDAAKNECGDLFTPESAELRATVQAAKVRIDADAAFFASAVKVEVGSAPDSLAGRVVHIEELVSSSDGEAGYLRVVESEDSVCMHDQEQHRTHWGRGRGGGRGGSRSRGWGWSYGGSSSSHKSSYTSKKRGYRGTYYFGSQESVRADPVDRPSRLEHQPRCRTVQRWLVFRLPHPTPHRLQKGDFVSVYATATPSPKKDTMYLVEPRITLLTRGNLTLIATRRQRM